MDYSKKELKHVHGISPKHKALKKKTSGYTGKKGEYSKTKQGNWHKVHPLDRV